jgi:hypothetical protein
MGRDVIGCNERRLVGLVFLGRGVEGVSMEAWWRLYVL